MKTKPVLEKLDLTPVRRDFAFIVEDKTPSSDLVRAVQGAEKALISDISVFDVYDGKGIEDGQKSVALEVTIQPKTVTLKDQDIDAIAAKIVKSVEKIGGTLRG